MGRLCVAFFVGFVVNRFGNRLGLSLSLFVTKSVLICRPLCRASTMGKLLPVAIDVVAGRKGRFVFDSFLFVPKRRQAFLLSLGVAESSTDAHRPSGSTRRRKTTPRRHHRRRQSIPAARGDVDALYSISLCQPQDGKAKSHWHLGSEKRAHRWSYLYFYIFAD